MNVGKMALLLRCHNKRNGIHDIKKEKVKVID